MRRTLISLLLIFLLAGCGGSGGDGGDAGNGAATSAGSAKAAPGATTAGGQAGVGLATTTITIETSGGDVRVEAEVADDMNEMERGLMERTALAEDAGMLFVYPEERTLSFWMKNTLIPLSIAFMDSEGRIVDIQDMKPLDDQPPHYTSAEPARYALEVNQGFFDERDIEVGDRADL